MTDRTDLPGKERVTYSQLRPTTPGEASAAGPPYFALIAGHVYTFATLDEANKTAEFWNDGGFGWSWAVLASDEND